MITIQPYTCKTKNLKTGLFLVATQFTIKCGLSNGAITGAVPFFYDAMGAALPNGSVPLTLAPNQTAVTAQTTESSMIALVVSETPGLAGESVQEHVDRAGKSVVVQTRGVVLV
jgi:hypothetical protein